MKEGVFWSVADASRSQSHDQRVSYSGVGSAVLA